MRSADSWTLDRRYLAVAGGILALSVGAYYLVGRWFIQAVYQGRIPMLSGLLENRTTQGVGFYLRVGDKMALMTLAVEVLVIVMIGVLGGWLRFGTESTEWVMVAGAIVGIMLVICVHGLVTGPVRYEGDASEYFQLVQSFTDHGTPDLRLDDMGRWRAELSSNGLAGYSPMEGYFKSPVDSKWYSYHFWGYPLLSIPARWLLLLLGLPAMKAFGLLNILLFFGSLGALLLAADMHPVKRATLAALLALSPVVWYMPVSGSEVFSTSLVVFSIVFFTRGRYALATLLAAWAATQNTPLLLLAGAYFVYATVKWLPEKRYGAVAVAALAGAVGLVPMAFYYSRFGVFNLIESKGFASWSYVTLAKVVGLFLDLDMGLLPYLPLVTIVFFVVLAVAIARRDLWTLARGLVVFGMAVLAATTVEWNSGAIGLMRYATWMLPVVIWVVVDSLDIERRGAMVAGTLIAVQLAALFFALAVSQPYYRDHSIFGRIALARAPWLYSPPAEEFAERSMGVGWARAQQSQPIAYASGGQVTKILADKAHLARLADYYEIDPALVRSLEPQASDVSPLYYVNLGPGQATVRTQNATIQALPYRVTATIGGPSEEAPAFERFYVPPMTADGVPILPPRTWFPLSVTVRNSSTATWYPGGSRPVGIVVITPDASGQPLAEGGREFYPLVQAVFPGEIAVLDASLVTPDVQGSYRSTVEFAQKDADGVAIPVPGAATEIPVVVSDSPPMPR